MKNVVILKLQMNFNYRCLLYCLYCIYKQESRNKPELRMGPTIHTSMSKSSSNGASSCTTNTNLQTVHDPLYTSITVLLDCSSHGVYFFSNLNSSKPSEHPPHLEMSLFPSTFLYHFRFLLVWRVRRTFFPSSERT